MEENKTLRKLDQVLSFIVLNGTPQTHLTYLQKQLRDIEAAELDQILQKLVNEGYIEKRRLTTPIIHTLYVPTFDGRVFCEEGGFEGVKFDRDQEKRIAKDLEKQQREMQDAQIKMMNAQTKSMEQQTAIQASQREMMKMQTDMMKQQIVIQKSLHFLNVLIAAGMLIAAIYYLQEIIKNFSAK